MRAGDHVRRADGSYGTVQAVAIVYRPQVMYNLTVAGAHTFFVGAGQWLVHNTCKFGFQPFAGFETDVSGKGYHMNFTGKGIKGKGELGLRAVKQGGEVLISVEALGKNRSYDFSGNELKQLERFLRENTSSARARADYLLTLLKPSSEHFSQTELLRRAFGGELAWRIIK